MNAVTAGKVVTVSKTNITSNGWTGVGYIVMDHNTGAAAYMIGGASGAYILLTILWACLFILAFIAALTLPFWAGVVATVLAAVLGIKISNFIKKVFGMYGNLSLQQVLMAIIDIIGQIALSAGLVALGVAGVPAGIVILAAVFIIAAMIMLDYIVFFAQLYRFKRNFFSRMVEIYA